MCSAEDGPAERLPPRGRPKEGAVPRKGSAAGAPLRRVMPPGAVAEPVENP